MLASCIMHHEQHLGSPSYLAGTSVACAPDRTACEARSKRRIGSTRQEGCYAQMGSSKAFSTSSTSLFLSPGPFFPSMVSPLCFCYSLFFLSFLLVDASHLSNLTHLYDLVQPHAQVFPRKISRRSCSPSPAPLPSNCFPAVGFSTPSDVPASTNGWWCDPADEFGFLGFSYEVTYCECPRFSSYPLVYGSSSGPSLAQLQTDFANMRKTFNSRYVRLYGTCDNEGF